MKPNSTRPSCHPEKCGQQNLLTRLLATGIFFLMLASNLSLPAQVSSRFGDEIPPYGTIRLLLVFAQMDCDPCGGTGICGENGWPLGDLPDPEMWFDTDVAQGDQPTKFVTKYYWDMSMGRYLVLGDYIDSAFTVSCNLAANEEQAIDELIVQLNQLPNPLTTENGYELDDFDFWDMQPSGIQKTNTPDGFIDGLIVIWRNMDSGFLNGNCRGRGFNRLVFDGHSLKNFQLDNGASFNACGSTEGTIGFFMEEYFHGLFGGNRFHISSGFGAHTFLSGPGAFSMTSQPGSSSNVACGWDRMYLGWTGPGKTELVSALDASNNEVATSIDIQSHPNGGTFILRDFVTHSDAIQIRLPHFNFPVDPVKNQFLWLENHQKISEYDRSVWEDKPCKEDWTRGIYAYLQIGKEDTAGATNDVYGTWGSNGEGSWLFPLSAEGNYDFKYRKDLEFMGEWYTGCLWVNRTLPYDKTTSIPNPLTGCSDLYNHYDYNEDGTFVPYEGAQPALTYLENGTIHISAPTNGDGRDAFNSQNGLQLNLSTNPAPLPVYTHRSTSNFNGVGTIQNDDNRTIFLNGLDIEVTGENVDGNGAIEVEIAWDNFEITDDVRWCGNIILQNDVNDPLSRTSLIDLQPGNTILLDQGTSITRNVGDLQPDGSFIYADPTILTIESGTELVIRDGAHLKLINGSSLHIRSGAFVLLEGSGKITIDNSSFICVDPGATLELNSPQSSIVMEPAAQVGINPFYNLTPNCQSLCDIQANINGPGTISRTYLADAGPDIVSCNSVTGMMLGGNPSAAGGTPPYTFSWEPSGPLTDASLDNPVIATPLAADTEFTLTVTDADGCTDTDRMTVFVNTTTPSAPAGLLANAHLEQVTAGQPDDWEGHHASNEPTDGSLFFLSQLSDPMAATLSNDQPSPGSGCRGADVPLDNVNGHPAYFAQKDIGLVTNPLDVYILEAQFRVNNSATTSTSKLDVNLISDLSVPGEPGSFRKWELSRSFDLNTSSGANPISSDWQAIRKCISPDIYWTGAQEFDDIGLRFFTSHSPATDIEIMVDHFRLEPITNFTEPVSGLNYVVQDFYSGFNSSTIQLENNYVQVYDNSITSADFPNAATAFNRVYNFTQSLDDEPAWNNLTRYLYDDASDVEMNGTIILQPYTHFNVIGDGDFILGENGSFCLGQGSELVLPGDQTFIYNGGQFDMMYPNACLGVFGGTLEIAAEKNMDISRGFAMLHQNGTIELHNNSKLTLKNTGQLLYQSGAAITLSINETLQFDRGSGLKLEDGGNSNPLADQRLQVILDCGELVTNWNKAESSIYLPKIRKCYSWKHLAHCEPDLVVHPVAPSIDVVVVDRPEHHPYEILYDIDLSGYPAVNMGGSGTIVLANQEGIADDNTSGHSHGADQPTPMITIGNHAQALVRPDGSTKSGALTIESGFHLKPGAHLRLEPGAKIEVHEGANFIVEAGARISLTGNAQLHIEEGAYYCIDPTANVRVASTAELEISPEAFAGLHPELKISAKLNCDPVSIKPEADFVITQSSCGIKGLVADGSASVNALSHTWSVTDENGAITSSFYKGNPPANFDFTGGGFGTGFNFLAGSTYTIGLTISQGPVTSQASRQITVDPVITLAEELFICSGDQVQLDAGVNHATYSWAPAKGLSDPSVKDPKARPRSTTNYTVTVTDGKGCKASGEVLIDVTEVDVVTTIAGNGRSGLTDGTGSGAQFHAPSHMVVDPDRPVAYIADANNHVIRQVDLKSKEVTTLAGNGKPGYQDGDLGSAQFNHPWGICIDPKGALYVTDRKNHCIRKINLHTRLVTTIAGRLHAGATDGFGSQAQFDHPRGISCDEQGDLYVADAGNQAIRKLSRNTFINAHTATDWIVSTLTGIEPPPRYLKFGKGSTVPSDVVADGSNNRLIIADHKNDLITVLDLQTQTVKVLAGIPKRKRQTILDGPSDIALSQTGEIYIADRLMHRIRRIDTKGRISTIAGSRKWRQPGFRDGKALGGARFNEPTGLALDGTGGHLYIVDRKNHSVRLLPLNCTSTKKAEDTIVEENAMIRSDKIVLRPNPFRDQAVMDIRLSKEVNAASLVITNLLGQEVRTYAIPAGINHQIPIDGSALKNGIYLATIVENWQVLKTIKMVVIK